MENAVMFALHNHHDSNSLNKEKATTDAMSLLLDLPPIGTK